MSFAVEGAGEAWLAKCISASFSALKSADKLLSCKSSQNEVLTACGIGQDAYDAGQVAFSRKSRMIPLVLYF